MGLVGKAHQVERGGGDGGCRRGYGDGDIFCGCSDDDSKR